MEQELKYQILVPPKPGRIPAKRWVTARYVEPSADAANWSYKLWDPVREEYVEDEMDSDRQHVVSVNTA